jgi:hypothetical protein
MIPAFKQFTISDIGNEFPFRVLGEREIALRWRVIPEDLGSVNNDGVFIPRRLGAGVLMAEPQSDLNIKPARAFLVIGEERFSRDSLIVWSDSGYGEAFPTGTIPGYIEFTFPVQQIIEESKIPITLLKQPPDYRVIWKVVPGDAGRVILNREFQANKLPEGIEQRNVKVFAFLHKGRKIVAWTSKEIRVIKAQ